MKQKQRTIYAIVKNGIPYRFTDIVNHGTHCSGKQILDNGSVGKMVHRITLEEMNTATIEQKEGK